jgi:hypothetical protein
MAVSLVSEYFMFYIIKRTGHLSEVLMCYIKKKNCVRADSERDMPGRELEPQGWHTSAITIEV